MITWSDTIDITCEMFQINQQQLAGYLNISESALSRIRHGKARALFDSNAVFNNVFNPHTKGSPASNKNEDKDALLTLLKEIIEHSFPKAREAMADCWDGTDYQIFVLRLLGRTRQIPLKKKAIAPNDSNVAIDSSGRDEPAPVTDTPSDKASSQADDLLPPGVFHPIRKPSKVEQPLQQLSMAAQSPNNTEREPQADDESLDSTPVEDSQAVSSSEMDEAESKAASQVSTAVTGGGAQLHIEDKYKCCRFCARWRGLTVDELAICEIFKEQRDAVSGRDCKYYKPDEGRITVEMMQKYPRS